MASTQSVLRLLNELADKRKVEMDYGGFGKMSEFIDSDEISQKFLDDTYRRVRKHLAANKPVVGTRIGKLNVIAVALGYKSFAQFESRWSNPPEPLFQACVGLWWSHVLGNVGNTIYKAPVQIFHDEEEGMCIRLRGKENDFRGNITLRAGSLFCELDSGREKKLYIILKGEIGNRPDVLQGTFAGISSTGDPIAGRELFTRSSDEKFALMKWQAIDADSEILGPRIRSYFSNTAENRIKIDNRADLSP